MYKIKSLALVALAIFLSGVFVSAAAQKGFGPAPVDPPVLETLNGAYTVAVNATELSRGDVAFGTGETYGWTCYGSTEGDLSGFMFVSMNYSSPAEVGFGSPNTVIGGSWSKLIFIKGEYAGSIYGKIVGGEVVWDGRGGTATISLQLTGDDGTGMFAGNIGSGTFEGGLNRTTSPASVSGILTLKY